RGRGESGPVDRSSDDLGRLERALEIACEVGGEGPPRQTGGQELGLAAAVLERGGSSWPWMRCSRFQVDCPWRIRTSRGGAGRSGRGRSGGSGRAVLSSVPILTFSQFSIGR